MKTKLLYLAMIVVAFYILSMLNVNLIDWIIPNLKYVGKIFGWIVLACFLYLGKDIVKSDINKLTNKFK